MKDDDFELLQRINIAERLHPGRNWTYEIGSGWVKGEEGNIDATVMELPSLEALKRFEKELFTK